MFKEISDFEIIHTDDLHIHILTEDPVKNASRIYNLNIGILLDLDTFTGSGLDTLSKNPAPIQITYIGYPNSTGLDFIHYRITDNIADHPESTQHNKEKLIKLPGCFLLYRSILQNGFIDNYDYDKTHIVLGALNDEIKNSVNALFAWKCILEKNPTCKLHIKINSRDGVEMKTKYYTKKLNVDKSRLIVTPYSDNSSYLQIFQTVDIVLDTFPYSGTTTTCNALYNSTPMVTMYNKHFHCHNVSSSILMQCGLSEFVTFSVEEYINKVTYLCNNIDIIRQHKRTIHKKFVNAMDPDRFMKGYENALIQVYTDLQNTLQ
jgi:predicted O-linked N-acetylglucosamine transferase (SPINDLY family)